MRERTPTFLALLLALTMFGCDDGTHGDPMDTTGNEVTIAPDATKVDATTADTQTAPDGDVVTDTGPVGKSCSDALRLTLGNQVGVDGVLDPAGDADYYLLNVVGGTFVTLETKANPDDLDGGIDTVISLYTADGATLLATADDAFPRISTDSELFFHSMTNQTLCVRVEEWSAWANETPLGSPSFVYNLAAYALADHSPVSVRDAEPNNDATTAQQGIFAAVTNAEFNYTYGLLDTQDDVDVFAFTVPPGAVNFSLDAQPSGTGGPGVQGHGSTLELGLVRVTDPAGNDIANADLGKGGDLSVPVVAGTSFLLWLNRAGGTTLGANDFYFLKNFALHSDSALELEQADHSNDDLASAEVLAFTGESAYLLGNIAPADDIDTHSFTATAGQAYALACGAARRGSGLEGATFSILDPSGNVMQSETENWETDLYWSNDGLGATKGAVSIPTDGVYYLRISATGQRAGVSSTYYRCGLHLAL